METDLQAIIETGTSTLVTFLEDNELVELGVPDLGERADALGLDWYHVRIPNAGTPDKKAESLWQAIVKNFHWDIKNGQTVVIHCKGGLGRTGMMTARLLMDLGKSVEDAIAMVRKARPGAIETRRQERHLKGLPVLEDDDEIAGSQFAVTHWKAKALEEKRSEDPHTGIKLVEKN